MFYTLLALLAGMWALRFASRKVRWVREQDPGTERMRAIARAIQDGAMAFLSREYRALGIVVGVVTALLFVGGLLSRDSSFMVALSFVTGAGCSAMAGYVGVRAATDANVRTANAARTSAVAAFQVAFSGGTVMGMVVAGLGLCGLTVLFFVHAVLFGDATMRELRTVMNVLAGFSLGASSIALLARIGGGIFAAAADAACKAGGMPEDDSRNPVAVADSVGDTVGDVAGVGADLFESYVGSILAAMVLGVAYDKLHLVILPLVLAGVGVAASILGTRLVRIDEAGDPLRALNRGSLGAGALMLTLAWPFAKLLVPGAVGPADNVIGMLHVLTAGGIYLATASGLLGGIAVAVVTEYHTAAARHPARYVATQSRAGTAANIIAGLGLGMVSTAWPVMVVAAAIGLAFFFAGLYGVALAGLGMLSTVGLQLAVYAYGPISINASGIADMGELGPEVQERTDRLDAAGHVTAAVGKGFAIDSAALTALALFAAYRSVAGVRAIDIGDPYVMGGLLFGAMVPFLFSAMTLRAVADVAAEMVEEMRRERRFIPGLVEGAARADVARCVDVGTAAALRRMVVPGTMAVVLPVAVGLLDKHTLAGMLAGVTVSGVLLAMFLANAGGAWGSARRNIEGGRVGGEGAQANPAVAVGDAVGDPLRTVVGPSLGILMKLMAVVALVMAPLLA